MNGQVTVRLYAPFSDAVGRRHLMVPAAQAVPLAEFLAALADSHPALRPYLAEGERQAGSVLPVLNGRFARAEDLIRPGDELLLCAQISGGAPAAGQGREASAEPSHGAGDAG